MERELLDEIGKKAVLDIEIKAEAINVLLPLLDEAQRNRLKELSASLEPFKSEAAKIIIESTTAKGE